MTRSTKGQNTRDRMIESAIALLREHGAAAVTIDAVVAHSGAPRGSVYHHFPGGRKELLLTAGDTAARFMSDMIDLAIDAGTPAEALDQFVGLWCETLRTSDYRTGCPVAGITVDAREDIPEAAALAAQTFTVWRERITAVLVRTGADPAVAPELSTLILAGVEGALLLCRADRSTLPLEQVAARLRPLLETSGTKP